MKNLLLPVWATLLFACSGNPKADAGDATPEEKQDIFPVTSFIEGQVHMVADSFRLPLLKFTTINNQTDSVLITPEEFRMLVKEFTTPDITSPSLKELYKGNSFADQSIPSITFTYAATSEDLEIQRMDVIIAPDPVLNDKVKSIYIEKTGRNADTFLVKKLYWKTDKEFQIITSKEMPDRPASVIQVKVRWDNRD